ncbi:hypothetical protein [Halalkalibacter hemicellulosilyticus]|uniref:Uncharacterized protein n=1 Tax=Halalkalibacter hemicellulosilyticusJCM 9152 TaxID=1236971 RepID=W4QGJ3_9BACI|nr:hypothetical protein [Halalkalibacter hemicellulosilyticus]GAE30778.1 hypothetical protein JCM9152_2195 [Halalkalibacter hemicellulosilyticusJCM 9152]
MTKQTSYNHLFQQVYQIQTHSASKQKKSPTIAELAAIVGDTEEHILECLEFGKDVLYH